MSKDETTYTVDVRLFNAKVVQIDDIDGILYLEIDTRRLPLHIKADVNHALNPAAQHGITADILELIVYDINKGDKKTTYRVWKATKTTHSTKGIQSYVCRLESVLTCTQYKRQD